MDVFRQPSYGENYHKLLKSIRDSLPVSEVEYDGQRIIFITGYQALRDAFLDAEKFPPHAMYKFNTEPYVGRTVMSAAEPDHSVFRKLSMPAFKLKAVANYGAELIDSICIELIDRFSETPDLISEFAHRLPALVIARMLGLPKEVEILFEEWNLNILYRTSLGNAQSWGRKLGDYLRPIVLQRRTNPQNDIITELTQADLNGRRLSDEEIISHIRLLMPVGADPVYQALSNTLYALFLHEGRWQELQQNPALVTHAIEEAFRWEAPIALLPRLSGSRPVEFHGCQIRANQPVFFGISAAHRDGTIFESPDMFDIHRRHETPLLTFGPGPKHCPGIHLAKLEINVALQRLLERIKNPELVSIKASSGFIFRAAESVKIAYNPISGK